MKIYTKTGDEGKTALYGGKRISKADLRIDAYGTVDELNAHLGLLHDSTDKIADKKLLNSIQTTLFTVGSLLASNPEKEIPASIPRLAESDVEILEKAIDKINETVKPLQFFILPGGHISISQAHIARCVCRRAERLVVALANNEPVEGVIIKYLNRLSDYLFTYARKLARDLKVEELEWKPNNK